jgi:hypothetical protein
MQYLLVHDPNADIKKKKRKKKDMGIFVKLGIDTLHQKQTSRG